MSRPRHRRPDPQRTGPLRNAGETLRGPEPWPGLALPRDDAASAGVREGYRVIEEQIRRGRRMAQRLDEEPGRGRRYDPQRRARPGDSYDDEPWPPERDDRSDLLTRPLRHLEGLLREILRQLGAARLDPWRLGELLLRLQIEALAELARLGFATLGRVAPRWGDPFEEDASRVEREIADTLEEIEGEEDGELAEGPWPWPPAPSVPATIRSTVPIPVYLSAHERTEVDLELPAGSQALALELEPPASAADRPALPAFEAEFVALADGPTVLRIEVPRDLPAGRYPRRVVTRATGEPVGTLIVQVGAVPRPRPRARKP